MLTHRKPRGNMQQVRPGWHQRKGKAKRSSPYRASALPHLRADGELPGVHEVRQPESPHHQSARHAGVRQDPVRGALHFHHRREQFLFTRLLSPRRASTRSTSTMHLGPGGGMAVQRRRGTLEEGHRDHRRGLWLTETPPAGAYELPDIPSEYNGSSIGLHVIHRRVDPDDNGTPLGIGRWVASARGPQVMKGYWQPPEETAKGAHARWLAALPATSPRWTTRVLLHCRP